MDSSDLKNLSVGPMKIIASGSSEYILGDALDPVPDDTFRTLSSEDLESKWCLNSKKDDKSALAALVAQVTNEGNCRKRLKQEDTINQNNEEDDKSALSALVAQVTNEGNCSKRIKLEDTIKQEEPDDVSHPSESYIPSTYATRDLVPFLETKYSKIKLEKIPSDDNPFEYHPKPRLVSSSGGIDELILPDLSCSDEQDESKEKDLKSLQCMMYEDPQVVVTKIPTRGKTLKVITGIQKATTKKETTNNIGFVDKDRRTLPCSSSNREKTTDTTQGSDTLWGESQGNQVEEEEFKYWKLDLNRSRTQIIEQAFNNPVKSNEKTDLNGDVKNMKLTVPTIKGMKFLDKSMSDFTDNASDSKLCNNPKNMTLFNKRQQAVAKTESLPQTSDNTTVDTWQTDSKSLRDDNREDGVLDPSKSCSGDIFCLCSQCRPKSHSPSRLNNSCKYACDLCGYKFNDKRRLKVHKESRCGLLKLFSCDVCCRGFTVKSTLLYHIRTVHGTEAKKTVKRNFTCNICQKTFASKQGLQKHNLVHKIYTLTCDFCGKVFSSKKNLQKHVSSQHNDKRFECAHCSKEFKTKFELISHIEHNHMGLKNFKCTECCSVFATNDGLEKHLLRHSLLSRKYVCEYCAQTFHSNYGLKRHLWIHTNEKPFVCDICGKCFRTETNLYQHAVTHSDKRPFACDVCDKSFRIKHHLRQHMAVHGMVNTSSARNRKK